MCAILGSISSSAINNHDSLKLDLMRMSHRGPDYSSIWKSENNKVFLPIKDKKSSLFIIF